MSESLYLNNGQILTVSDIMKATTNDNVVITDGTADIYGLCANEESLTWLDLRPYLNDNWEAEYTPDHPYGWVQYLKQLHSKADHAPFLALAKANGTFIWGNEKDGGLYVCKRSSGYYDLYMWCGYGEYIADTNYDKYYIHNYPTTQNLTPTQLSAVAVAHLVLRSLTTGEITQSSYIVMFGGSESIDGDAATATCTGVPEHTNPVDSNDITYVSYVVNSNADIKLSDTFQSSNYVVVNPLNITYKNYTAPTEMYVQYANNPYSYDHVTAINFSQPIGERGYSDDPEYDQMGSWWGGDSNKVGEDPNKGPKNTTGGGGGVPSSKSDPVDFPGSSQFAIDATTCGFVTIWHLTAAEMVAFNQWLFASFTEAWWDTLKKILQDPLDFVIGAGMVKYTPTQKAANQEIYFNGIASGCFGETTNQWEIIDMGYIDYPEQFESYLDFQGYSDIKISLPFIGIESLDINDCIGGRIYLKYYIDNLTGACTALIKIDRTPRGPGDDTEIKSVLYAFTGNCMQQLPLYAKDYTDCINAITQILTTTASSVATGSPGNAGGVVNAMTRLKPTVVRSGSLGSNFGMMQNLRPYLILERPIRSIPDKFGQHDGYPSAYITAISNLNGYCKAKEGVNWCNDIPNATNEEKEELNSMLTNGFVINKKYNAYDWEVTP